MKQFFKFFLVGLSSLLLQSFLMVMTVNLLGIEETVSVFFTFPITAIWCYIGNSQFTFKDKKAGVLLGIEYIIVSAAGLVFQMLLMYIMLVMGLSETLSLLFALIAGFPINYVLSKRFVWVIDKLEQPAS